MKAIQQANSWHVGKTICDLANDFDKETYENRNYYFLHDFLI